MSQRRTLLVDDDKAIVELATSKLEKAGIAVDAAYSAEEALTMMRTNLYQVAVADIHLPGMKGTEMISSLKGMSPLVQIIMVTGDARSSLVMESIARGAVDFVVKSDGLDPLVSAVCDAFDRAERWDLIFRGHTTADPALVGAP